MQKQLFRQKTLDRVSSPEQLHDYMRVTNPAIWMLLGAVVALLAGLLVLWMIELIRGRFYRLPDEGKREDPEQMEKALETMDQISNEIKEEEET